MKVSYQSFVFLCLSFFAVGSFAGNNDELVPRKGLGPLDKAKVNNVQAQKWSRVGKQMTLEILPIQLEQPEVMVECVLGTVRLMLEQYRLRREQVRGVMDLEAKVILLS